MKNIILQMMSVLILATPLNANEVVPSRDRDNEEKALVESANTVKKILETDIGSMTKAKLTVECAPEAQAQIDPLINCPECCFPQKAMEDLNSEPLKFMGRDLIPGHDQNRSCIFQNELVYVLYHNCTSSRKEAPALDFQILSKRGGIASMYFENFDEKVKGSKTPKSQMEGSFTVGFNPTEVPGDLKIAGIKSFMSKLESSGKGSCWVGDMGKANMKTATAHCQGDMIPKLSAWGPSAETFWSDPGESWLPTQAKLRKLVETVPF